MGTNPKRRTKQKKSNKKSRQGLPHSEGEKRAVAGYHPQYQLSAERILERLVDGSLHWIKVTDPDAGRVDDVQIAFNGTVSGYQFECSLHPGTFTFNDLTKERSGNPNLICQLADGWKRLKQNNSGNRVVVHLVTNDYPSSNTSADIPANAIKPASAHFAGFVEQVWKQAQENQLFECPLPWLPAWTVLKEASNLNDSEWSAFVSDCKLEFAKQLPLATSNKETQLKKDIASLAAFLFEQAASPARKIRFTLKELLQALDWEMRFKFFHQHKFPMPDHYEPNETSLIAIYSMKHITGGYLGLFGSPGTGKSTLLSDWARDYTGRLIRYYIYVPDHWSSCRGHRECAAPRCG